MRYSDRVDLESERGENVVLPAFFAASAAKIYEVKLVH